MRCTQVRGAGGEMNPKGQHFVRTIKNSSNHLLNIINDILDVAALKVEPMGGGEGGRGEWPHEEAGETRWWYLTWHVWPSPGV